MTNLEVSLHGRITGLPPLLKKSTKGSVYCKMFVEQRGIIYQVMAFREVAEAICAANLATGAEISIRGKYKDDAAKEARDLVARIVGLPGGTAQVEQAGDKVRRWWGSEEERKQARAKELAYQAAYGRVLAYDAEGNQWFHAEDDTVMLNGKRYIKLEAEFIRGYRGHIPDASAEDAKRILGHGSGYENERESE